MAPDDLIMTIDSDAEDIVEEQPKSSKSKGKPKVTGKTSVNKIHVVDEGPADDKDALNPEFTFDFTGDVYDEVLNGKDALGDLVKGSKRVSIWFKIVKRAMVVLDFLTRSAL